METRKKLQSGWTLKGKIWTKLDPFLEMGITLKFTETNFWTIQIGLFVFNLAIIMVFLSKTKHFTY